MINKKQNSHTWIYVSCSKEDNARVKKYISEILLKREIWWFEVFPCEILFIANSTLHKFWKKNTM